MKHKLKLDENFNDGRMPAEQLYSAFGTLAKDGWIGETVITSSRDRGGKKISLPIPSFRTQQTGDAIWILSGIHGEEPAGPNALAAGIDLVRAMGREVPTVLLPLCNPLGYATNWRYLNRPDWRQSVFIESVGDSEHVLPAHGTPSTARAVGASCPEAAALAAHVLRLAKTCPPVVSLDFHEDDLLDEGYIYSQGASGARDVIAQELIGVLRSSGVPIRMTGKTRFGEEILNGIVGPQSDGSIDELLAAKNVIINGKPAPGPFAQSVLVIETPAAAMPLPDRVRAHLAILKHLRENAAQYVASAT